MDADDAGHHRKLDPVCLHPGTLLDMQLNECLDRLPVLLHLEHPVEVAAGRCQHLADGDVLPIEPIAESLDVQLSHEGQAADEPERETNALLIGKADDLDLPGQRIAGKREAAKHFERGDRPIGAVEPAAVGDAVQV